MPEFKTGVVQANKLRFHYLEIGEGPLALCLHGFPDSPWTYRYLLPELARAGYRAVAPSCAGMRRPRSRPTDAIKPAHLPLTWSLSTERLAGTATPCLSLTIGVRLPPLGPRRKRLSAGAGASS